MMKHKNKLISISLATLMLVSLVAVVGLSVSAAKPTVGSAVGSAPATISLVAHSPWVFVKGSDGNLYYTKNGLANPIVWTTPNGGNLGAPPGGITSDPAVISETAAGTWHIFVRGGNGGLYTKASTDGATGNAWTDWSQISAGTVTLAAGTGPAAYQWTTPLFGVFYVDSSANAVELIQLSGGSWTAPVSLGGVASSSPSATVVLPAADNSVDVFVRGQSGGLWQSEYATGGFTGWTEVPGAGYLLAGTGPSAVSLNPGEMDVLVTGGSSGMWYQHYGLQTATATQPSWQTATTGSAYTPLGGVLTASPGATSVAGATGVRVFVRGGEGNLYTILGIAAVGPPFPSVYTWAAYTGPLTSPV